MVRDEDTFLNRVLQGVNDNFVQQNKKEFTKTTTTKAMMIDDTFARRF